MLCNKNINVINKNHNKHCTFYPDVIEDMGYILKSCPSAEKVLTKSNLNINQCLPLTLWLKKNISHSSQGLDFVPKIVLFFFNSPFGVLGCAAITDFFENSTSHQSFSSKTLLRPLPNDFSPKTKLRWIKLPRKYQNLVVSSHSKPAKKE